MRLTHGTRKGPWLYTARGTGRRLTHEPSGWYVPIDCLAWRVERGDVEAVDMAIGHAARKPWATRETIAALREALAELRLIRSDRRVA